MFVQFIVLSGRNGLFLTVFVRVCAFVFACCGVVSVFQSRCAFVCVCVSMRVGGVTRAACAVPV